MRPWKLKDRACMPFLNWSAKPLLSSQAYFSYRPTSSKTHIRCQSNRILLYVKECWQGILSEVSLIWKSPNLMPLRACCRHIFFIDLLKQQTWARGDVSWKWRNFHLHYFLLKWWLNITRCCGLPLSSTHWLTVVVFLLGVVVVGRLVGWFFTYQEYLIC